MGPYHAVQCFKRTEWKMDKIRCLLNIWVNEIETTQQI